MNSSVLVNCTWLRPGQVGGSEQYATSLLGALAQHDERPEITLAVGAGFSEAHRVVASAFDTLVLPSRFAGRAGRMFAERSWLARRMRDYAVVHHLGGTAGSTGRRSAVLTLYDLQFLSYPEYFRAAKRYFLRRAVPGALKRCEVICVISQFVRDEVIDRFGVDADRIHVVSPAIVVSPVIAVSPAIVDENEATQLARPTTSGRPFILYPAVTWPHKNHRVLLEALRAPELQGVDLVLTGGRGPAHGLLDDDIASMGLEKRVIHLGRVSASRLDELCRAALALVFPSRHEGFGQPVVEAMARGCPVVTADVTALPEVVGQAGRLVDPDDSEGWVTAIDELGDSSLRLERVRLGYDRAAGFSPQAAASSQVAAYRHSGA